MSLSNEGSPTLLTTKPTKHRIPNWRKGLLPLNFDPQMILLLIRPLIEHLISILGGAVQQ